MAKVAVFDSGVGGLSILQALQARIDHCSYVFISDNQAYPYGTKSAEQLEPRVLQCAQQIIDQFDPDILVLACNTASTLVLPLLREHLSIPIVGVVPAIKPAAAITSTKVIGLLGTPATIDRIYTRDLIQKYASDAEIISVGSHPLVELAEQKLAGKDVDSAQIAEQLKPFLERKDCDVLVLACTHFPLLNKEIKDVFEAKNHSITLVDSAQGIANRTAYLLEFNGLTEATDTRLELAFTKALDADTGLSENLRLLGFENSQLLAL